MMANRVPRIEALESRAYLSGTFVAAPADAGGSDQPPLSATLKGGLPAAAISGQKIKPIVQTLVLTTNSDTTVQGTVSIELLLSIDPSPSSDDLTVTTVTRKVNLKPGKHTSIPLRVTSLPELTEGTFYLVAGVTAPNDVVAAASTAGTMDVSPPIVDLAGQFLSVPATAQTGKNAKLTFGITNSGNVSASGTLTITLTGNTDPGLDPSNAVPLGTITHHVNIKSNGGLRFTFTGKVPNVPAGAYYLVATLDPDNVFNDIDTFNNTFVSSGPVTFT
jgi:hypothetical protein